MIKIKSHGRMQPALQKAVCRTVSTFMTPLDETQRSSTQQCCGQRICGQRITVPLMDRGARRAALLLCRTRITFAVARPEGNFSCSRSMTCVRKGTAAKTPKKARTRDHRISCAVPKTYAPCSRLPGHQLNILGAPCPGFCGCPALRHS